MKTLTLMVVLLLSISGYSQNVTRDTQGNFVAMSTGIKTAKTYTDSKGVVYAVYQNLKGKFFVMKYSDKKKTFYRMYLKE